MNVSVYYTKSHPPHMSTFFFFNDTATTEIYTLSLHDALPIFQRFLFHAAYALFKHAHLFHAIQVVEKDPAVALDRKSTRLNSSHGYISYAVFCLKKKKINTYSPLSIIC